MVYFHYKQNGKERKAINEIIVFVYMGFYKRSIGWCL